MTILYDARRPVKPARRFGLGLTGQDHLDWVDDQPGEIEPAFKTIKEHEAREAARHPEPKPTEADREWWAEYLDGAEGEDLDARAHESYATDALTLGLIPRDLAEGLMATSIIGHDA